MKKIRIIKYIVKQLKLVLSPRQRRIGIVVLALSIASAMLQMLGVSVIAPLVSAMNNSGENNNNILILLFAKLFGVAEYDKIFMLICAVTIAVYVFKNIFCLFQAWVSIKYSCMVQRELSVELMKKYLKRSYDFFLNYSTAEINRDTRTDAEGVYYIINCGMNLITELLTIFFILAYMFYTDILLAACIGVMAIICITILYSYFKKMMKKQGTQVRILSARNEKIFLEAIGGIKEVIVMQKQDFFLNEYSESYSEMQKPSILYTLASIAPTYVIEGVFVTGIMTFICARYIFEPQGSTVLPYLASFAIGAVRMLPSMGRISSNLNSISYYLPTLDSVYEHLTTDETKPRTGDSIPKDGVVVPNFDKGFGTIFLEDVSWKYKNADDSVLDSLNLKISQGESIGIIGASGAGKTTLIDIILGLHQPQEGGVFIDGVNINDIPDIWCKMIGYVPQKVYLIDGSIKENVAFGEPIEKIDEDRVIDAIKKAQLFEFIQSLPEGINSIVGERGARLSGGQSQRIAIARALYREPQVLILDEATSALDSTTETEIMKAVELLKGKITTIIIAHRLSTVMQCNTIYEIVEGKAIKRRKEELNA